MKKKYIKEVVESYVINSLDGKSFEGVVKYLDNIKVENPKHINFKFKVEYCYEYTSLYIEGERLETDAELNRRKKRSEATKKAAKRRKLKQEVEERELLEKLRKKYA